MLLGGVGIEMGKWVVVWRGLYRAYRGVRRHEGAKLDHVLHGGRRRTAGGKASPSDYRVGARLNWPRACATRTRPIPDAIARRSYCHVI